MYYTIIALALGAIGLLHLVFAFTAPPAALRGLTSWTGGPKIRRLISFVPVAHQERVSRVTVGALLCVASVTTLIHATGLS